MYVKIVEFTWKASDVIAKTQDWKVFAIPCKLISFRKLKVNKGQVIDDH
jgi:hypothetical protein